MEKKKEENIQKLKNLEEEKKSKKESIQKEKISLVGSTKYFINTETQVITEEKIKDTESKKKKLYIYLQDENSNFDRYLLEYEYFFTCNHCGIKHSRDQFLFYCTACDFCICIKCHKDYFFYKGRDKDNQKVELIGNDIITPSLCKCFFGEKILFNCKLCNSELNPENFNYYCSNCNSNFCSKCYPFHRVIFKENILTYDGHFSKDGEKNGFGITFKKNNEKNYEGYWTYNKFELIKTIPHSHKEVFREEFNKEYICDICSKNCDIYDTGMFCTKCDLKICDLCVIEINRKTLKRKDHPHELNIAKFNIQKLCSVCKKNKKVILFICPDCNRVKGFFIGFFAEKDYYCCVECFNAKTYKFNK